MLRIGIDLGGTKIEVAALAPDDGRFLVRERVATPPGSNRSYRATIYVQDPALDARSLKVALQSSGGGAVDPGTVRAVEDAILTRARQLRIQDANL